MNATRPFLLRVLSTSSLALMVGALGALGCDSRGGLPGPGAGDDPSVAAAPTDLVLAPGTSLAAGGKHVCAVLSTGAVTCWGDNSQGQLGANHASIAAPADPLAPVHRGPSLFVDLGTGRTAKVLAAGYAHTCAILDNDQLKCWGDNYHGQLGQGDTLTRGARDGDDSGGGMGDSLPYVNVGTGRTVKAVTTGSGHTCVILDTNQVKCWGRAYEGPLGYGDGTDRGGSPGTMGDFLPVVDLGTGRTAKAIAADNYLSTCAILDDNKVKCWGINQACVLGQQTLAAGYGYSPGTMGDNLPYVNIGSASRTAKAISSGGENFCVTRDNNTVKCWGRNRNGAIGVASTNDVWGCEASEMGEVGILVLGGNDATSVSTGGDTACATRANGDVKCWGSNFYGQLGQGDGQDRTAPPTTPILLGMWTPFLARLVSVGEDFACAVSTGNRVKCWGRNDLGQLGNGETGARGFDISEMGDNLPFALLGPRPSLQVILGGQHACAILSTGQMKCWGANGDGQAGVGNNTNIGTAPGQMGNNLPVLALGSGRTAKWMAAGRWHTCADLDNNTVKCWGWGGDGELGYGNTNSSTSPPSSVVNLGTGRTVHATLASPLAAGDTHTCAILDNSTVKCWGQGTSGQLGMGDNTNRTAPPSAAINLGSGRTAKALALGSVHSCALLDNNTVKCWGWNGSGQLGLGNTTTLTAPSSTAINLGSGRTAKAIGAGADFTCALLDNDTVKCWGWNGSGQLGLGHTTTQTSPPATAISLGTSLTAVGIAVGANHACALLATKQVKCWGYNGESQLGIVQEMTAVDDLKVGNSSNEMGDFLPLVFQGPGRSVKAMTAGLFNTCFLLDTNQVRCVGSNTWGALGLGDMTGGGVIPTAGLVDLGTDP